jgi:DSF synthase
MQNRWLRLASSTAWESAMNSRVDFSLASSPFEKKYQQIDVAFEPQAGVAWTYMNPSGAPCFNLGLLRELRAHDAQIEACPGRVIHGGQFYPLNYYVVASRVPGIFNLGGDLALFALLIKSRDRDALLHYARLCVDNMYPRICNYNGPMTTISLVQGEALGGGFETALSSNVIIAEKRSRMGMPEILFNLFPGMGAYSLLSRRIGMRAAEDMVLSGRIYSAGQLYDMGVVDVLAEDGAGESAVYEYVRRNERRRNGAQAVFACRQHVQPISYEEMMNVTNVWVDAALRLDDKDLKLMSRIVRSQLKRIQGQPVEDSEAFLESALL